MRRGFLFFAVDASFSDLDGRESDRCFSNDDGSEFRICFGVFNEMFLRLSSSGAMNRTALLRSLATLDLSFGTSSFVSFNFS